MDLFRGLQEALLPRDAPLLLILHGIVGACGARARLFLRLKVLQAPWKVYSLRHAKITALICWGCCTHTNGKGSTGLGAASAAWPVSATGLQAPASHVSLQRHSSMPLEQSVAWGTSGSSQDGYAKGLCAAAYAAGYRPAVLNYRCSLAPSSLSTHCPCEHAPRACYRHACTAPAAGGQLGMPGCLSPPYNTMDLRLLCWGPGWGPGAAKRAYPSVFHRHIITK